MNLSPAELAELPLAAALFSGDDVVANTPEWRGPGPGAVAYSVRGVRLVVGGDDTTPECLPVLARLLDELDATAAALAAPQSLRVAMLAASLRLLAGRVSADRGTSDDVLEHVVAGAGSRTELVLSARSATQFAVIAPQVAALVLVQFAANAERHDRATAAALEARDGVFTMSWQAAGSAPGAVTARRRAERARWGLGFARIAADAIGAAVFPPLRRADGLTSASLEVGLPRLALPLCAVRDAVVLKATRAWDEETTLVPRTPLPADGHAARCVEAARWQPGAIVVLDGWSARCTGAVTWVAIPPDGILDRARDVLDGIVHERALWDRVPEAPRVRIVALAAILASLLGAPLPRVPAMAWNDAVPAIARALALPLTVPRFAGVGAIDPHVALFLAAEFGECFRVEGDDLLLRVRADRRDGGFAHLFLGPGDDSLRLS